MRKLCGRYMSCLLNENAQLVKTINHVLIFSQGSNPCYYQGAYAWCLVVVPFIVSFWCSYEFSAVFFVYDPWSDPIAFSSQSVVSKLLVEVAACVYFINNEQHNNSKHTLFLALWEKRREDKVFFQKKVFNSSTLNSLHFKHWTLLPIFPFLFSTMQ